MDIDTDYTPYNTVIDAQCLRLSVDAFAHQLHARVVTFDVRRQSYTRTVPFIHFGFEAPKNQKTTGQNDSFWVLSATLIH